jgi:hypothetical protein
MFMPLIFGRKIVIGSRQSVNVFEDNNFYRHAPYDFLKITPSHLELLKDKINGMNGRQLTRKLVIGGEALQRGHIQYLVDAGWI